MTTAIRPTPDQQPGGWGDGAAAYDEWFAPLTAQFAADVVEALELAPGQRFLDVAAGTGVLARAAATAGASVLAVDVAPGMVELLRASTADLGLDLAVEQMDGQSLAVRDGEFDAAASLFGLIFFPDLVAGARELRRAVRPGGRIAVVSWDRTGFPLPALLAATLREVVPDLQPGANASMRLGRPESLTALLHEGGLHGVRVRSITHEWRLPDPAAFLRNVPLWSQPVRPIFEGLTPAQLERAAQACVRVVETMSGGTGVLSCTALVGTAVVARAVGTA